MSVDNLIIIYHNPLCSKSRAVLSLLENNGIKHSIRLYLKDGVDADEVVGLAKKLGMHPSEFVRKSETEYKQLETDEFSIEEWSAIIEASPILLERPILVRGKTAIIARPPEKACTFLKLTQ